MDVRARIVPIPKPKTSNKIVAFFHTPQGQRVDIYMNITLLFNSTSIMQMIVEGKPKNESFQILIQLKSGDQTLAFLNHTPFFSSTHKTYDINIQPYAKDIINGNASMFIHFPISLPLPEKEQEAKQKTQTTNTDKLNRSLTSEFCGINIKGKYCFINSYIQVLYYMPAFQKMILSSNVNCPEISSVASLFNQLNQRSHNASTKQIASAVGLDSGHLTPPVDVREFYRIILSDLESETKSPFFTKFYGN
jgi:calcineurin-like phosphoesterase family protein